MTGKNHQPVVVTGGSGFIGTNLMRHLKEKGMTAINYDRAAPIDPTAGSSWRQVDLTDDQAFRHALDEDRPDVVVHLAAVTSLDDPEDAYVFNVSATRTLMDHAATVRPKRVVVASTMLVHPLGAANGGEMPTAPTTAYGRSKAAMEDMIRQHACEAWTIVRPTTIWGPWHLRLAREFIARVARGHYVHPSGSCRRTYGYVENACHQILTLLNSPRSLKQTYYLADQPIRLEDYIDGFSRSLRGRPARRIPKAILAAVALAGDGLRLAGIPFPLSSYRLSNMTSDNVIDVSPTIELCGSGPYTLEEAVTRTVAWWKVQTCPVPVSP